MAPYEKLYICIINIWCLANDDQNKYNQLDQKQRKCIFSGMKDIVLILHPQNFMRCNMRKGDNADANSERAGETAHVHAQSHQTLHYSHAQ